MRKLLQVLVTLAMLGSLGILNPPEASASETGTITFEGDAAVGGDGLCAPVTTTPAGTCATRSRTFSFSSSVCDAAGESKKDGGSVIADPACTFGGSGSVQGNCGSSDGQGSGTATVQGQTYTFTFSWDDAIGGALPITGTITKTSTGQSGPFTAPTTATPDPASATVPPGSCLNGDGSPGEDDFIFAGTVAFDIS